MDALRKAAAAADAALLVTHYYAPVPAIVHNAIDWLTMRWNGSELHDKPLAVMGYSADCYRGVWSYRQTGQQCEIRNRASSSRSRWAACRTRSQRSPARRAPLTNPHEQALSVAEPQNMDSWSLCGRQNRRMADPLMEGCRSRRGALCQGRSRFRARYELSAATPSRRRCCPLKQLRRCTAEQQ